MTACSVTLSGERRDNAVQHAGKNAHIYATICRFLI